MRKRAVPWGRLALALAIPSACAEVTEAVATSASADAGASSSGAATNADGNSVSADGGDTTQGSASADDTVTAAGDTTAQATSGAGSSETSSELTSTTSGASSDDAGTTTGPAGDICDPDVADSVCDTCVKMACCLEVQTCFQDPGCACVSGCVGDGFALLDCLIACGIAAEPPGAAALLTCVDNFCGAACA